LLTAVEIVACGRHAAEGCDARRKILFCSLSVGAKASYCNATNVSAAPYVANQCATDQD
jgi:hypothetical protein